MLKKIGLILFNIFVCLGISDNEYEVLPQLFYLDDYDLCMKLGEKALYCTFTFEVQPIDLGKENVVWNIIKNVSSDPRNYRHDHLRHGICVPTFCSKITEGQNKTFPIKQIIQNCYNKKYEGAGIKGNISVLKCHENHSNHIIDIYSIIFGILFMSYILFVIISSIYEGVARYKKKDIYERIVSTPFGKITASFSIPSNWHRLTSLHTHPDAKKLKSIQGIRCYNMICVILTHTIMVIFAGPILNPWYAETMTRKPLNMFLANGNYAVQTFFVISGWLLSFHFFEMMENRKTFNLKYLLVALLNRYIRLTPTMAVMIAFESTWLPHLGEGPNWDAFVIEEYQNCRKNWWTNLLYVNNYIDKNNMCLHQTWYIAADTQLYALSLIILTIIWKYEKKANFILGTMVTIGLTIPACIAYFKNYDIIIRQYPEILYKTRGLKVEAWHDLYSSAYSNICGYNIGLIFGYIFYKTRNQVLTITKVHHILWWILTFGMCDFIVLIAARMYDPEYKCSAIESALYWAFGKNIFGLGIAIGIYGFTIKIGWFARWLCEWKAITVIGRLTYSTYIVHTAVVRVRGGLTRSPVYVNDYLLIMTTMGDIVLSYLIGTLMCLFFEMPISALQKLMVSRVEPKPLKDSSEKSLRTLDMDDREAEINENISNNRKM